MFMFVFSKAEKWYDIIQIFQSFLESRNMMIDLFYFHNNIAMYTPHFRSKLVPPCTTWNSNIIAYILEEAGIGNSYSYAYVESSCYSYVIEANMYDVFRVTTRTVILLHSDTEAISYLTMFLLPCISSGTTLANHGEAIHVW